MIRILVQFRVRPEGEIEARSAIGDFVMAVRELEPETQLYESYVAHDGRSFFHLMEFSGPAAEESHRNAEHTRLFVKRLYPLCEREPEFTRLELFDSNRR